MKRIRTAIFAMLLAILMMTGCAAAEIVVPEATEQPRPAAEDLTAAMQALEPTEEPSFQNFKAVTLTGETVDQTIFSEHKVTMINIWGTFCNPCIQEMPDLAALNEAYGEGEFQVVGLVIDMLDSEGGIHPMAVEAAWMIIDATGAAYQHLLPTDDLIYAKLMAVSAVPETVFVDWQGNILTPDTQYLGARSYDDWKSIVDGLLVDAPELPAADALLTDAAAA